MFDVPVSDVLVLDILVSDVFERDVFGLEARAQEAAAIGRMHVRIHRFRSFRLSLSAGLK